MCSGGVTAFLSILLFFIVSCLGEYAYLQIFPAYTLAAMSEIAGIQRLDALFIRLCMMTLVIRIACGLFAVSECISRIVKPRVHGSAIRFVRRERSVRALGHGGRAPGPAWRCLKPSICCRLRC